MKMYRCKNGDVINIANIKKIFHRAERSYAFGYKNVFEVHLAGRLFTKKLFVNKDDYNNILRMMGLSEAEIENTYE